MVLGAVLAVVLGDDLVVVDRLRVVGVGAVGDGQLAVDVGDLVAGGHVLLRGVHDLGLGRDVVALADQRLGAGDLDGLDRVALCQLAVGLRPAVVGQLGAVVDLLVGGRRDGDGDGLGLDRVVAVLLEVAELDGDFVLDAAGGDVGGGHDVLDLDLDLLAGGQRRGHLAHDGHALGLVDGEGLLLVVDVLDLDGPLDGVADVVLGAVLAVVLGDDLVIGDVFVGNRQLASRRLDKFVVGGDINVTLNDLEALFVIYAVVVSTNQDALRRGVINCCSLSFNDILELVFC